MSSSDLKPGRKWRLFAKEGKFHVQQEWYSSHYWSEWRTMMTFQSEVDARAAFDKVCETQAYNQGRVLAAFP